MTSNIRWLIIPAVILLLAFIAVHYGYNLEIEPRGLRLTQPPHALGPTRPDTADTVLTGPPTMVEPRSDPGIQSQAAR